MLVLKRLAAFGCLGLLAACASTPPVTATYYHPTTTLEGRVVRSIACSPATAAEGIVPNQIFLAHLVTSKATHGSDYESGAQTLAMDGLDNWYANSDVTITLRDDGRLAGINTKATGQGGAIVEAALEVVALAAATDGPDNAQRRADACKDVRAWGDEGVLKITFAFSENFASLPTRRALAAIGDDEDRWAEIAPAVGDLCLMIVPVQGSQTPPFALRSETNARGDIAVNLRQPVTVRATLSSVPSNQCVDPPPPRSVGAASRPLPADAAPCLAPTRAYFASPTEVDVPGTPVWEATAPVSQCGEPYSLPIPRAALFGQNAFGLALAESGAVTTLTYGTQPGTAEAIGAAGQAIDAFNGDTTAQKGAALKAEADLIAAQQRLLRCRADATAC